MIRKMLTAAVIGSTLLCSGCVVLGVGAAVGAGIAYTVTNDAYKIVDSSLFELFTSTRQLLANLGVQQYRDVSNTEECQFDFVYQNLTYKIEMKFVNINQSKITVSAVSNGVFKNKEAAKAMLIEVERAVQGM